MGGIYNKGDIIFFKNLKLANYDGSSRLDIRVNGHPFIILNDVNDFGETALCLKCSSSKKGKRKKHHFIINNMKMKGVHNKLTYVDVSNVYKIKVENIVLPVGKISNEIVCELIENVKDKINI